MFLSDKLIINGYKRGIFPMAESADDPYIFWVSPEKRGVIFTKEFYLTKSLKKIIKKNEFIIKVNHNFKTVILCCSQKNEKRTNTWINNQIIDNYTKLFEKGLAKSVECYHENKLVGGLYGVKIGSIFFGESMFSHKPNASKVALAYLAALLKEGGFKVIDTQFITEHLKQFGAKEIPKNNYLKILEKYINQEKIFPDKLKKNILDYFN